VRRPASTALLSAGNSPMACPDAQIAFAPAVGSFRTASAPIVPPLL
jgi:hypothetical protein